MALAKSVRPFWNTRHMSARFHKIQMTMNENQKQYLGKTNFYWFFNRLFILIRELLQKRQIDF